jgi:hypothetical protein
VVSEPPFQQPLAKCPYKRPYNSGTIRIRLLRSASVTPVLTCGNVRLATLRLRRFRRFFAFLNRVRKFESCRGRPQKSKSEHHFSFRQNGKLTLSLQDPHDLFFVAGTMRGKAPGRWEFRLFLGKDPITGKPKQVSRVYTAPRREPGAGRREAAKQLAALVAEVERGGHVGSAATFGVLLEEWTAHGERMGRSPKTLHEYRRKIDKQIRPVL